MERQQPISIYTAVAICMLCIAACRQKPDTAAPDTQNYYLTIEKHRASVQNEFLGEGSPLPDSVRVQFRGIQYYPVDTTYRVQAIFTPRTNGSIFRIRATGDIADMYQTAGDLQFTLQGVACTLEVYKNLTLEQESDITYYFIPFFDRTNGSETYGGGRYLDMSSIQAGRMLLDFNMAYQPYCFYNHEYSCPIPPAVNTLPVSVFAGEKM